MQTLNVGAGRTDQEYAEAQEQRRTDLLEESRTRADLFFWAAVMATLGTGLFPIRINLFLGIGAIDLLTFYGRSMGALHPLVVYSAATSWVSALIFLGFMARRRYRWAFLAGIVLYGADMVPLLITFSMGAFGVHSLFVFMWWQGQKALQEVNAPDAGKLTEG